MRDLSGMKTKRMLVQQLRGEQKRERDDRLVAMWNRNPLLTLRSIGAAFGVSRETARTILKSRGVNPRLQDNRNRQRSWDLEDVKRRLEQHRRSFRDDRAKDCAAALGVPVAAVYVAALALGAPFTRHRIPIDAMNAAVLEGGSYAAAAQALGISRLTLYRRLGHARALKSTQ